MNLARAGPGSRRRRHPSTSSLGWRCGRRCALRGGRSERSVEGSRIRRRSGGGDGEGSRSTRRVGGLYTQPQPVATGHYVIVLARENAKLRDRINEILKARMRDGTLERIDRNWGIWDGYQPAFFASVLSAHMELADRRPRT